jgi:cysteine desulfurase
VSWVGVEADGTISLSDLERAFHTGGAETTVALMAANHETGVVQPVPAAAELSVRASARLHVDAVQWFGKASTEAVVGADSFSLAAHKLGGPKGIGALVFRGRAPERLLAGGAQERGLRPGTQDAVLAAGFAVAVELAQSALPSRTRLEPLRDALEHAVQSVAVRNGTGPRLGHVSNLSFSGRSGPELVAALDLRGVCVSSGSACSAGTMEPSPGVIAMVGLERAHSAVRFSLGTATTERDVERTARALHDVLGTAV